MFTSYTKKLYTYIYIYIYIKCRIKQYIDYIEQHIYIYMYIIHCKQNTVFKVMHLSANEFCTKNLIIYTYIYIYTRIHNQYDLTHLIHSASVKYLIHNLLWIRQDPNTSREGTWHWTPQIKVQSYFLRIYLDPHGMTIYINIYGNYI